MKGWILISITLLLILGQAVIACSLLANNETMCCGDRIYLIMPLLLGILVIGGYMTLVTLKHIKDSDNEKLSQEKATKQQTQDLKSAQADIAFLKKENADLKDRISLLTINSNLPTEVDKIKFDKRMTVIDKITTALKVKDQTIDVKEFNEMYDKITKDL